jgi:GxxExxY protein
LEINKITEIIIGCAIDIHKSLGPGLLESAYEKCLIYEINEHKLSVKQQVPLPVKYKNVQLDCAYRLDLLIEDCVVIELKSVEAVMPIHKAQLLSYLKLSGFKVGLLINFNVNILKDGIIRIMN